MMQKKLAAGLAVLLAAGMALSSCGESGAAGNDSVINIRLRATVCTGQM